MPRRRKRHGKRRRRTTRHSSYLAYDRNWVLNKLPGFPANKVVKMRYTDHIELNAAALSLAVQQYRANSVYDPDYTGGGANVSCMGFDQWKTFYNHYCVIGAKITIEAIYSSASTSKMAVVGIYLSDDTTIPSSSVKTLADQGRGVYRPIMDHVNSGIVPTRCTLTFSPKTMFGIKDVQDNISRIGAQTGANPTEEAYFNIYAGCLDGSDAGNCEVFVTIDYSVLWTEPKSLPSS